MRRVDFHAVLGHDVVVLKPDAANVDFPELDDDINRATVFFGGDAGKADITFPSAPPALNTMFVAGPGADDVQVILVECETPARAAIVDHLGYARGYLPVAHRSALVYADVFICVQATVDAEDTYRQPVYIHNEAVAFDDLIARANFPPLRGSARDSTGFVLGRHICSSFIRTNIPPSHLV